MPEMKRKIVQIAAATDTTLYALCDDGSLWVREVEVLGGRRWSKVEGIPDAVEASPPMIDDDIDDSIPDDIPF